MTTETPPSFPATLAFGQTIGQFILSVGDGVIEGQIVPEWAKKVIVGVEKFGDQLVFAHADGTKTVLGNDGFGLGSFGTGPFGG